MAFAIFYDDSDLRAIAIQVARADMPANLAVNAQLLWDGGINTWQTALGAPYVRLEGDAFTRITVVQCSIGLQGLSDLLYAIAAAYPNDPAAQYMNAIASDLNAGGLGNNSAAVEPWP